MKYFIPFWPTVAMFLWHPVECGFQLCVKSGLAGYIYVIIVFWSSVVTSKEFGRFICLQLCYG